MILSNYKQKEQKGKKEAQKTHKSHIVLWVFKYTQL